MDKGRLLISEMGLYGIVVDVIYYDDCMAVISIPGETGQTKIKRSEVEIEPRPLSIFSDQYRDDH